MDSRTDTEDAVIEQVPHYSLTTLDDGSCEKLRLIVELPGVESSAGLHVEIEGNRAFVHLPGRYRLDLPLGVTVADTASVLKFVKNRQYLKAEYEVVARSSAAAGAAPPRSRKPERTPSPPHTHPDQSNAFSPRNATNGLHDSFMADAVKLRDAWRSTAQGARSSGVGSSKQASSKRASARTHTPSSGEAPDQEEPNMNGHRAGQVNGWQRGFLNQAAPNHNKAGTASSSAHEQEFEPDGSRAESSGASSSEQWEPHDSHNGHFAEKNGLHATPSLEHRGDSASSNLYETAKVLSNREAAAECASKAQDALAEADFDKAERLFQKAERLAPGQYAEKAQAVERRRKAHEAQMAAKKREEREAAKRKKREEDRRKREEQQRLEEQQKLEEEQRRKAEAARAAAEEETARRQEQERASARQKEQDHAFPDFSHERFWGYLSIGGIYSNIVITFLFIGMCQVLYFLGAGGIANRLQVGRRGSMQQRTCIGLAALAFWALGIFAVLKYTIFCLRCVWSLFCVVFWKPPLSAAIVESCLLGLFCFVVPGLTVLIGVPLMWHFVGGRWSAVHGTVACLLYVMYMDIWLLRAPPALRPFSFAYKVVGPLLYIKLALMGGNWWLLLLFTAVDLWAWHFLRTFSSEREKTDEGAGVPMGSESCKPEPVPNGAAPEVARVLQASSWYAVLEVGPSATVEEVRKAHKVKSLVTHPDKLGAQNRGAHEASVRVNTARDVLADAQKRAAYDTELRAAAAAYASPPQSPSGSGMSPGFFTEFTGRRAPCTRTADHTSDCVCMPCKACSQWHHVYVTSRPRTAAYFCTSCRRHHPGVSRTVWKETVSAGFFSPSVTRVYLYALGCTLDITDITDSCEFWRWIASNTKGPSCHTMLQFKSELPIREECFTAYKGNQEAASNEARRSAKRKGGRRRR